MPKEKGKAEKAPKGSSRIKQVGDTFWVLAKDNRVKSYKGFTNSGEAERHAAGNPVEKKVKITAERNPKQSQRAKKKSKKEYKAPSVHVVNVPKNDGKVQSFSEGKKKYGKGK